MDGDGNVVVKLQMMQWGLVPSYSALSQTELAAINARGETVFDSKKMWYKLVRAGKRCIIVSDGYYEWKVLEDGSKQPHYITLQGGKPMLMAGLYDQWTPSRENDTSESKIGAEKPKGKFTYTVITTPAAKAVGHIHDRMPLILKPNDIADWLGISGIKKGDSEMGTEAEAQKSKIDGGIERLVRVYDGGLESRRVGGAVGSVKNEGEYLIRPYNPERRLHEDQACKPAHF